MTKKQYLARKRNWLIMRLKGARSIFTYDNIAFMEKIVQPEEIDLVTDCNIDIDRLIKAIKEEK